WKTSALINGIGAIATAVVLVIVTMTKTLQGAWIILLLIPILVVVFRATRAHYYHVASQLSLRGWQGEGPQHSTVLVPIGGVHRAVLQAIGYARSLSQDVRAVFVDTDPVATEKVRAEWQRWGNGTRLEVLASPYRSLMEPLLEYIDELQTAS